MLSYSICLREKILTLFSGRRLGERSLNLLEGVAEALLVLLGDRGWRRVAAHLVQQICDVLVVLVELVLLQELPHELRILCELAHIRDAVLLDLAP